MAITTGRIRSMGIPLPVKNKKSLGENADSVSNCDDVNGNVCNNNDGSKNCDDAGTKADEKHEEKVVSASETEQKEVSADNANTVLASVSENSTGGASQNGSSNGQGKGTFRKEKLNGSEKRKKKASKRNNGNEPEKAKKQDSEAVKQPLTEYVKEEEKKTVAEYEVMREEKKKSSEASKTELRKVTAEGFKDCQVLEKKLDDYEAKVKGKEAAAKDGKPKKVKIPLLDLSFRQPPRHVYYAFEDGSSARGRFNGGFQLGGSRDNSTEPRVSERIDNGRAAPNEAGFYNGNGTPRGAYNGRGNGALRGNYSGRRDEYRGNGGYGYDRGHDDYQGNGGYHHQQLQGGQNQRHYQQRGNSGDHRNSAPAPDLVVEDMTLFPALPAPTSARATAPDSAPASAPAPSPASAPATAPALSPAQA